jgi:hypothetical protein
MARRIGKIAIIAGAGAIMATASGVASDAMAQSQDVAGSIARNGGIFIDGRTFTVRPGTAKRDVAAELEKLGARELGPGAIVFRLGDRLYIIDRGSTERNGAVAMSAGDSAGGAERQPYALRDSEKAGQPPKASTDTEAARQRGTINDPDYPPYDKLTQTFDEDWGSGEAPKPIAIEYVPPRNSEHQQIYDIIRKRRMLETMREMFSVFRLPVELKIETIGCDGVSNAWYQRENKRPTIKLCYEYLAELMPKEKMSLDTMSDALCGQLMFAAAHEFGHALIDIFEVPVFGRQEDAADQLATYFMLQFAGDVPHKLIWGAAFSYEKYIKNYKDNPQVTLPLAAFSSDHGAPQERFYNLLCIAYGEDAKLFADVIADGYLPEHRARNCDFEYGDLKYAIKQFISPHVDHARAKQIFTAEWLATAHRRPGP